MSLQEVREQNIALVTQTALACFVENGNDKTTIRDIAHRAGLTERSVYRYFATKDELVVAAAFLYWDRAKAQAAQALVSARQPGLRMPDFSAAMAARVAAFPSPFLLAR